MTWGATSPMDEAHLRVVVQTEGYPRKALDGQGFVESLANQARLIGSLTHALIRSAAIFEARFGLNASTAICDRTFGR